MSTKESYLKGIRRTLEQRSGGAADAGAITEATLGTWLDMSDRLTPVIGAEGVYVILRRSLHLTSADFPWIATAGDHMNSAALLVNLKERLVGQDTNVALEGSCTLLATSIEILSSLVGESMIERLLGQVWLRQLKPSGQENSHE